jgi:hypothetical protein
MRVKGHARPKNASKEDLDKLCQYLQDTSPVKDILINPVSVKTALEVTS